MDGKLRGIRERFSGSLNAWFKNLDVHCTYSLDERALLKLHVLFDSACSASAPNLCHKTSRLALYTRQLFFPKGQSLNMCRLFGPTQFTVTPVTCSTIQSCAILCTSSKWCPGRSPRRLGSRANRSYAPRLWDCARRGFAKSVGVSSVTCAFRLHIC